LERLKGEMGSKMWWVPRGGTNPRGFGISLMGVRRLKELASAKGNLVATKYKHVDVEGIRELYWDRWYRLLKCLAFRGGYVK